MGELHLVSNAASLAKIRPPQQVDVLSRHRLFDVLEQARRYPLVWLSAPGGSGKTTLIGTYLQEKRPANLWYQLDEGDADVATFFYYMTLALGQTTNSNTHVLPLFTAEYQSSLSVFARNFFRQLFAHLDAGTTLVLDNYQDVPADSVLHEVIKTAAQETPPGCNIIVGSRVDPPPGFARLRATGRMQLIGWEDLKLTPDETQGISQLHCKEEKISEQALAEIYDYTQGWAAALVLLLERVKNRALPELLGSARNQEQIFDYFAGEIFEHCDAAEKEFMLKTAFLPKFSTDMAAALSGNPKAEFILGDLTRRNYFTTEHAGPVPTFEYHPLFRAFLRKRASSVLSGKDLTALYKNAAAFLAEGGQAEKAVPLLHSAQDWAALVRLVLGQAQSLVNNGRWQTLEEWIRLLPGEIVHANPVLIYWLGVCRLPFVPGEARNTLADAYSRFKALNDTQGQLQTWCGVVDSVVFDWGTVKTLDDWIAEFENDLAQHTYALPEELAASVACSRFMALMLRQPQHPDLHTWAQQAWHQAVNGRDLALRMKVGPHLLMYYTWWIGDLAKAELLLNALRPFTEAENASPLVQTTWCAMASAFYWMSAENEQCVQTVEEGLGVARDTGVHAWDMLLYSQAVFATLSSGDHDRAAKYLEEMARLQHTSRPMDNAMYFYLSAWYEHSRGRNEVAKERAKTAMAMAVEAGNVFGAAIFVNDYARTLFYCGDYDAARETVERSQQTGKLIGAKTVKYLCYLVLAEMALMHGDDDACVDALRACLAVGRQQGFQNHTWWDADMMARLYDRALDAGIETEYVSAMIRCRGLIAPASTLAQDAWPWPIRIYCLGRFLMENDGQAVSIGGKSQKKPLALLKALIAFGGQKVAEARLCEALWPDAKGEAAHRVMAGTLHRLRKIIGAEAIQLKEGYLSLNPRVCWLDVWAFQRLAHALGNVATMPTETDQRRLQQMIGLYQGPFLHEDNDATWALRPRERLRSLVVGGIDELAGKLYQMDRYDDALQCYRKGLEVDDLVERFYQGAMRCHLALNRRAEGQRVYERCRAMLADGLGVAPLAETETLHEALKEKA